MLSSATMSGHLGGLPMRSVTSVDILAQVSAQAASVMCEIPLHQFDATVAAHATPSECEMCHASAAAYKKIQKQLTGGN